jgi:probable F420-dependent oxidoreductase
VKFLSSVAFNDPAHFCALARTADTCGWDGIIVSDHVVHPEKIGSPYPYTADGAPRWQAPAPWPDPWVSIGAMAAVTERLRFYTGIYVLPLRNPFVVAKAVGTAAYLSDYRVSLGVGVGWMREEFELLEQDFRRRGRRTEEMIEVMRKLWAGGMVEHHGEFYDFERLQMSPALDGPVPILVGGLSEPALRRAARYDGWISDLHTTDELRGIVAAIRRYRSEYGRDDAPLQIVAACKDAVELDGYRRLEEAGVTHLQTMPWVFYGLSGDVLEEKQEGLRRFADDIIARMAS